MSAEITRHASGDTSRPDANAITQRLLDVSGEHVMAGNFDGFLACFDLPHYAETYVETRVFETANQMRAYFAVLHDRLTRVGVTDVVRACISAEFRDADHIITAHETRLMRRALQMQDAYPSHMTLIRRTDGWKIQKALYAVPDDSILFGVLRETTSALGDT